MAVEAPDPTFKGAYQRYFLEKSREWAAAMRQATGVSGSQAQLMAAYIQRVRREALVSHLKADALFVKRRLSPHIHGYSDEALVELAADAIQCDDAHVRAAIGLFVLALRDVCAPPVPRWAGVGLAFALGIACGVLIARATGTEG